MWGHSSHVNDCEILFVLVIALQIPIPPSPLRLGDGLQREASLKLAGEHLNQLLPASADPAPVADEPHGPEQVPFDHSE
jgi:hypothetical protein